MITRLAKVIDNDDKSKLGRVKVEIIPELQDISENFLPWAIPKQDYDTDHYFKVDIPDKNSYILVDINDTWTSFVYDESRPYVNNPECKTLADSFITSANISPTHWKFSKNPKYIMYENSNSNEVGIVFDNNMSVKYTGSTLELKNGNKTIVVSSNAVNINNGHLVVT